MKKIMFPASFDPIHQGHIKLISRALKVFDQVVVVVTNNYNKSHDQLIDERYQQVCEKLANFSNVIVIKNSDQLTAKLAQKLNIIFLLRGIRNTTDLDYEYQLANANQILNPELQTIYFFADENEKEISSTLLKEINSYQK
ncbi:pantetheine-phosphate adenylyltransferase [Mesoplasma syrphidae]|uniref:Phosphopantetheine adenylyltransferase n=1 Tax=Mesoplasma syrphidae TaxID=225999 RepID=A0A2K9C4Y8_9MOLU|nr:pantetheine-phosphate adenylyltransferase [Mesoplasma syrphidae]AUF83347.1 pantetheine-phosphate adenylyltransferase [Mesoplasma syrphidae]